DMGKDEFGHAKLGGIANILAREIESRTKFETRAVVLGHIQRGGSPTAFDRVLATRYGLGAIDMVHRGEFGCMAALRSNKIVSITLKEAISKNRVVDDEMIEIADGLFEEIGAKVASKKVSLSGLPRVQRAEAYFCFSLDTWDLIDETLGMAVCGNCGKRNQLDLHAPHPAALGTLRKRSPRAGEGADGRPVSALGRHSRTAAAWPESLWSRGQP